MTVDNIIFLLCSENISVFFFLLHISTNCITFLFLEFIFIHRLQKFDSFTLFFVRRPNSRNEISSLNNRHVKVILFQIISSTFLRNVLYVNRVVRDILLYEIVYRVLSTFYFISYTYESCLLGMVLTYKQYFK